MEKSKGKLSQKELKNKIITIIEEIGSCNNIKEIYPEYFKFFTEEVFPRHPNYPQKVAGLNNIIIKKNYYGKLSVFFKKDDGTVEDISVLKKCITGKKTNDLQSAMRNAILPQILFFKNDKKMICSLCNNHNNIEVDHKEPQFIELYNTFIKDKETPKSFITNKYYSKSFKEEDREFERKWVEYHKKNATLQLLCKKCNGRKKRKLS